MKNKDVREILNKCFGKQKDDRYHAIAMLAIYGIFMLVVVFAIRLGGGSTPNTNLDNNDNQTPVVDNTTDNNTSNNKDNVEIDNNNNITNDINYSYSYTVTYNDVSEVFIGKKIDEKEKFTLVKDGIYKDYAILSDNYLVLEDGIYKLTENPSQFFKYCDVDKILTLVENEKSIENENRIEYNVTNKSIANSYKDKIIIDNELFNSIVLNMSDGNLKSIDLDLTNYISSISDVSLTLIIHMEFLDVGTTEDFQIKVS